MTDVRALQTMLDGGVTDPATVLAAIPESDLDPLQETMLIPDDDKEHDCRCGSGPYRAWTSGWRPPCVNDWEGEVCLFCTACGAEFEVVP